MIFEKLDGDCMIKPVEISREKEKVSILPFGNKLNLFCYFEHLFKLSFLLKNSFN